MKSIPWRAQLAVVAGAYLAAFAASAAIVAGRYLMERRNPADFNGGMAAFGDWMLEWFIGGLLLIPTVMLALVIRNREEIYARFSKVLLCFSLTAPISLGLSLLPAVSQSNTVLGFFCLYRMLAAPVVIVWLGASRLLARFKLSKRLLTSALLVETITIVLMVASMMFSGHASHG